MPGLGFHFTSQLKVREHSEQDITEVTGKVLSTLVPILTISKGQQKFYFSMSFTLGQSENHRLYT